MYEKVVYVAGPFRSRSIPYNFNEQEQNVRKAEHFALKVWEAGVVGICPHSMTRNWQGALPDENWLVGDLEIIRRCDGLFLVPGWKDSVGSVAEAELAKEIGIPVFTNLSALKEWADGEETTVEIDKPARA